MFYSCHFKCANYITRTIGTSSISPASRPRLIALPTLTTMTAFQPRWALVIYVIVVVVATFGSFSNAFSINRYQNSANGAKIFRNIASPTSPSISGRSLQLNAFPNLQTMFLADGALDAETLESLGDLQELNDALDGAIDAANPAVGILSKLVASPAFLAVPIGAGLVVSFLIGYFIFSYGQGKDD